MFVLSVGILDEEIERDDDETKLMSTFKVTASKDIDVDEMGQKSLYIIFLTKTKKKTVFMMKTA